MSVYLVLLYGVSLICSLYLIMYRDRSTFITLFWLLVLFSMPLIGIVLFLFFGKGIDRKKHQINRDRTIRHFSDLPVQDGVEETATELIDQTLGATNMLANLTKYPWSYFNDVELLTDGKKKFAVLKEDLRQAKQTIYIEYYAFITDNIGKKIVKILTEKANEGVEVFLLYDKLGSKGTDATYFHPLIEAGGKVTSFVTSQKLATPFGANYHDHHKVVVIDGSIGFIGGFNVADQYLNKTKKFGYWRDTHVRILGPVANVLQRQFLINWNLSVPEKNRLSYKPVQFSEKMGDATIQIVSSNPIESNQEIKLTFIKLITSAKKRIWIQTPYFIPDDSVMDALKIAMKSGVDVKIMIPDKPDHPFVYRATEYYSQLMMRAGVDVYLYTGGFLHSKILVMDDSVSVVGSANQDIRSYKLNFEASAVIINKRLNEQISCAFKGDMEKSKKLTEKIIAETGLWTVFKQKLFRLLSPIM